MMGGLFERMLGGRSVKRALHGVRQGVDETGNPCRTYFLRYESAPIRIKSIP